MNSIIERMDPVVSVLLDAQQSPFSPVIENIRNFLLGADPLIGESVKWNSANFQFAGNDRVTLNSRPGKPLIVVLHLGAKKGLHAAAFECPTIPFEWKGPDRAQITISRPEAPPGLSNAVCGALLAWMKQNQ